MKRTVVLIIIFFNSIGYTILANLNIHYWSYPYGGLSGNSVLELNSPIVRVLPIIKIDKINLPNKMKFLLNADLDGDTKSEIVAVSENNDSIWVIDFLKNKFEKIPLDIDDNSSINLISLFKKYFLIIYFKRFSTIVNIYE